MADSERLFAPCECADDCGEYVEVTADEYASAHREEDHVLVVPGHSVAAGSAGAVVVAANDRFAIVSEGWSRDLVATPQERARLAELQAQARFTINCECDRCERSNDWVDVEITLDEWNALPLPSKRRVIAIGHPTPGGPELLRNERFVAVAE